MPLQYINELLGIPGLQLHNVLIINANEVHLEAKPVAFKQPFIGYSILRVTVFLKKYPAYLLTLVKQGEIIDYESVQSTLKTLRNWQNEIINYHHCRWTNATVEGRHNRIKTYQRSTILHVTANATKLEF